MEAGAQRTQYKKNGEKAFIYTALTKLDQLNCKMQLSLSNLFKEKRVDLYIRVCMCAEESDIQMLFEFELKALHKKGANTRPGLSQ